MTRRIELRRPIAAVEALEFPLEMRWRAAGHAHPGEHACELLHVLLCVAARDAESVELHELARVVLVHMAGRVLRVVEILEHGRMSEGCHDQVAKMSEHARSNRPRLVVRDLPAQIRLALKDAEMIEPEPYHLLAQLIARIDRLEQEAARSLVGEAVAAVVERLAGGFLGGRI